MFIDLNGSAFSISYLVLYEWFIDIHCMIVWFKLPCISSTLPIPCHFHVGFTMLSSFGRILGCGYINFFSYFVILQSPGSCMHEIVSMSRLQKGFWIGMKGNKIPSFEIFIVQTRISSFSRFVQWLNDCYGADNDMV